MLSTCVSLVVSALLCGAVVGQPMHICFNKCSCLGMYVDCSEQMFANFPEPLPLWTEDLDLSSNKFDENLIIDTSCCSNLSSIKLSKNYLTNFPIFKNKSTIHHLNLAQNKIERINSSDFEKLPSLKVLDLNKNKLEFLEDNNFPKFNHLKILNLNSNFIANISSNTFDSLIYLKELKLFHNKLQHLPNGLFKKLRHLELLDLGKNHITVIEGLLFKYLTSLKTMILRKNIIEDLLDGSFYGLSNLQALHLEGNSLRRISKGWLYGLNSLVHLNVSHNKIGQIISGWEYCENLEELDLSHNQMQYIEKSSLQNLRKLQKLNLSNNRLSFIEEGSFNNTPLLRVLKMDNNLLAWMIEDAREPFIGLQNLKVLSLVNNNILYLKKEAFNGLGNLDQLNLLENKILEIEEESFDSMPNLVFLYLNSSSLVCDCSLSWIKLPYVFEKLPFDFINVKCGFPEQNKGKTLNNVSMADFLCSDDSPKPVVAFHPESKMVLEKQNITLKCGVNSSSSEKMKFVWKKDNHDIEPISSNHYSTFEYRGLTQYSILNLYNISMSQSGQYQCVASNEFGVTYSKRSLLSVVVFPFFAKVPRNNSVKTGLTATLECAANGFPPPQISWQKDGGTDFPAAQERRMKVKDDIFLIIDVKLVDMGVYSCTAKNVAGMIAANATLTVLEPPEFGSVMYDKKAKVGEEIVLECLYHGHPKPKITWKKDGNILATSNRHFFSADGQLLIIMETNTDDTGTYQCEIANSVGVQFQEIKVVIMPLYQIFIREHSHGLIFIAVIICIVIIFVLWVIFVYKAKRPSPALINNADNKSINSTNSKDSGTGESTKRSEEQIYNECLNPCQQLNINIGDVSPPITLPLLSHATVILGEDSVVYKNLNVDTSPAQLPIEKTV